MAREEDEDKAMRHLRPPKTIVGNWMAFEMRESWYIQQEFEGEDVTTLIGPMTKEQARDFMNRARSLGEVIEDDGPEILRETTH
jgi:hypothetical protein